MHNLHEKDKVLFTMKPRLFNVKFGDSISSKRIDITNPISTVVKDIVYNLSGSLALSEEYCLRATCIFAVVSS